MFTNKQNCESAFTRFDTSLIGRLLIGTLITVLLFLSFSHASAASWRIGSSGDCAPNYPRGQSMLWWNGYPSNSWGKTWGYLWYWQGGSWSNRAGCYGTASGSDNMSGCTDSAARITGSWTRTGQYQASFLSYSPSDQGNIFTCP